MIEQDKIQPQCVELEEAVIGAAMLYEVLPPLIFEILTPEMFYKSAHVIIWDVILKNINSKKPKDILSITRSLSSIGKIDEVGGALYISRLTNRSCSPYTIEFHARIIIQKFVQRKLITVSEKIKSDSFVDNADIFSLLSDSQIEIQNLERSIITGGTIKSISSVVGEEREEYAGRVIAQREGKPTGVNTGFSDLNVLTGGWQNSDLIILAARPAMGKTALALHFMLNADNVAFFSLEMKDTQLTTRLILSEADASSMRYRSGKLYPAEDEKTEMARRKIQEMNIFIDDTPSLSILDLKQKCRKLKTQNGIKLIIVDYLQLMTTGEKNNNRNREQEISQISSGLKAIAKELDVPVIALSQMNRAVETRGGDKKPQLSDLRESGAIEQDADMVIFIHRPEYYGMMQDGNGNSTAGVAEIIVAKHRNGGLATIPTKFIDRLTRFEDIGTVTPETEYQAKPLSPNIDFTLPKKDQEEDPF